MLKNSVGNLIRSKRKELNPFLLISLLGFESKIVLHETVSEMEDKFQGLSTDDREIVLDIIDRLIARLTPTE